MKYLNKTFSVFMSGNKQYEDNYNKIFRKPLLERIKIWWENLLVNLFIEGVKK